MSSEAIAALRKSRGDDFANLANQHLQHDLRQSDRDILQSAAKTFSIYSTTGSLVGFTLGALLAFRLRSARTKIFRSIRAAERPREVVFADGRREPLPDMTPLTKPTIMGDIATYTFFGAGGLFLGGETGLMAGTAATGRKISEDPESRERIERAWRAFRADVLRREAEEVERGDRAIGL